MVRTLGLDWSESTLVKDRGGVRVCFIDRPGEEIERVYRIDMAMRGLTIDDFSEGLRYENRPWDPVVTTPAYLKRFAYGADETVDVCGYTTKPAAAGIISSRSFVDARYIKRREEGGATYLYIPICEADREVIAEYAAPWFALTDKEGGVRGRNAAGSGVLLIETREGGVPLVQCVTLTMSQIGARYSSAAYSITAYSNYSVGQTAYNMHHTALQHSMCSSLS